MPTTSAASTPTGAIPELYVRWLQAAVFGSHLRFHGVGEREPWSYGDAVNDDRHALVAACARRLRPYLAAVLRDASPRPACRSCARCRWRFPARARVHGVTTRSSRAVTCCSWRRWSRLAGAVQHVVATQGEWLNAYSAEEADRRAAPRTDWTCRCRASPCGCARTRHRPTVLQLLSAIVGPVSSAIVRARRSGRGPQERLRRPPLARTPLRRRQPNSVASAPSISHPAAGSGTAAGIESPAANSWVM